MTGWSVARLWVAVIATGLLCAFFGMWFIQTAWLGSFPGADRDYYGRWSLVQFLTSAAFLVAMLGFGVALFRRYRGEYQSQRNEHG